MSSLRGFFREQPHSKTRRKTAISKEQERRTKTNIRSINRLNTSDTFQPVPFSSQVEEAVATFIAFGRASKIPPITESLTTSNISFVEGGVNNVSKPCSRLQQPLSVSRGVRSRPLEEEVVTSSKVETIPLLSPTMESDLLKEPWIFPQTKTIVPAEEDSVTTFPEWEEDFQDLSDWCMDPLQGQCDFPIGELVSFKVSGTKYEGKSILKLEEGVSENATRGVNEKRGSSKMNSFGDMELPGSKCQPVLPLTNSTFDCKKELDEAEYNESNTWLRLPRGNGNVTANKTSISDVDIPFQSQQCIGNLDLDDTCHSTFQSMENNQPESWCMLNPVQTSGLDTFNLLSYLCDDEIHSPGGSTSTEASTIFNSRSPIEQLSTVAESPDSPVETKMKIDKVRRSVQTRSTSTITSSSETFSSSSRKSERTRSSTSSSSSGRVEKRYSTGGKRDSKKRPVEDNTASVRVSSFNYRESREKNNEASRKSRMNKKAKETEMAQRAAELEKDNRILKMKVEELEKLVTSMRTALLRSALKKES